MRRQCYYGGVGRAELLSTGWGDQMLASEVQRECSQGIKTKSDGICKIGRSEKHQSQIFKKARGNYEPRHNSFRNQGWTIHLFLN